MATAARPSEASDALSGGAILGAMNILGDWDRLLDFLASEGFPITLDRRTRVSTLIWQLEQAGISLGTEKALTDYLAPILCTTAEDQAQFAASITRIAELALADRTLGTSQFTPEGGVSPQPPVAPHGPDWIAITIGVIFLAIVGISLVSFFAWPTLVWLMGLLTSGTKQFGGLDTPSIVAPSNVDMSRIVADLVNRTTVALPFVLLAAAFSARRAPGIARLLRDRGAARKELQFDLVVRGKILFRSIVERNAIFDLKRAALARSDRIDAIQSLRQTVKAWGFPTLIRQQRRVATELVLLVDVAAPEDHIAIIADALEQRIRATDAILTRYDFRLSPRWVTRISGPADGPAGQILRRVAERHEGHRLILISDISIAHSPDGRYGYRGIDPSLMAVLGYFSSLLLFTPTPEPLWARAERAFADAGFLVCPISDEGIVRASSIITENAAERIESVARSIQDQDDPLMRQFDLNFATLMGDDPPQSPRQARLNADAKASKYYPEIDRLVRKLDIYMGERRDFCLLAAIAAFPSITPGSTLAFGEALYGQFVDAPLIARLSRMPWIRHGRMPNWLRRGILRHLRSDERSDVTQALATALNLAKPTEGGSGDLIVAMPEDYTSNDPTHDERLFLAFVRGDEISQDIDLSVAASPQIAKHAEDRLWASRALGIGFASVLAAAAFVLTPELGAWVVGLLVDFGVGVGAQQLPQTVQSVLECSCWCLEAIAVAGMITGAPASTTSNIPAESSQARRRWISALERLRTALANRPGLILTLAAAAAVIAVLLTSWTNVVARKPLNDDYLQFCLSTLPVLTAAAWNMLPAARSRRRSWIDRERYEIADDDGILRPVPGGPRAHPYMHLWLTGQTSVLVFLPIVIFAPISIGLLASYSPANYTQVTGFPLTKIGLVAFGYASTTLLARYGFGSAIAETGKTIPTLMEIARAICGGAMVGGLSTGLIVLANSDFLISAQFMLVTVSLMGSLAGIFLYALPHQKNLIRLQILVQIIGIFVIIASAVWLSDTFKISESIVLPITIFGEILFNIACAVIFRLKQPHYIYKIRYLDVASYIIPLLYVFIWLMFLIYNLYELFDTTQRGDNFFVSSLLFCLWTGSFWIILLRPVEAIRSWLTGVLRRRVSETDSQVDKRGTESVRFPAPARTRPIAGPIIATLMLGGNFGFLAFFSPELVMVPVWVTVAVAAGAGYRLGRRVLPWIALGASPYLLPLTLDVPVGLFGVSVNSAMPGGVWPVLLAVFWARFAADKRFRLDLLRREHLSYLDASAIVAFVCLMAIASRTLASVVNSSGLVATIALIVAASRMPRGPLIFSSLGIGAIALVIAGGALSIGTTIAAAMVFATARISLDLAATVWMIGILIDHYRRRCLRPPSGWSPFLSWLTILTMIVGYTLLNNELGGLSIVRDGPNDIDLTGSDTLLSVALLAGLIFKLDIQRILYPNQAKLAAASISNIPSAALRVFLGSSIAFAAAILWSDPFDLTPVIRSNALFNSNLSDPLPRIDVGYSLFIGIFIYFLIGEALASANRRKARLDPFLPDVTEDTSGKVAMEITQTELEQSLRSFDQYRDHVQKMLALHEQGELSPQDLRDLEAGIFLQQVMVEQVRNRLVATTKTTPTRESGKTLDRIDQFRAELSSWQQVVDSLLIPFRSPGDHRAST